MIINKLANDPRISAITVYSITNLKSKNPGIITIKILRNGWEHFFGRFF